MNKLALKKINFMYVQVKYTGQGEMRKGITVTGVELPCRYCCSTTQGKKKLTLDKDDVRATAGGEMIEVRSPFNVYFQLVVMTQ